MNKDIISSKAEFYWKVIIVILLTTVAYLYSNSIQSFSLTPKFLVASILLLTLWFVNFRHKKKLSWSIAFTLWYVFLLQYIIQCWNSYNYWDSLFDSVPMILGPMLILFLYKKWDVERMFSFIAITLAIVILPLLIHSLIEVFELVSAGSYSKDSTYNIQYSFGHKNQYTQFLALCVPILVVGLILAKSKWEKIVFTLTISCTYVLSMLLMNRTSIIVLYAVYPIAFVLIISHVYFTLKQRKWVYMGLASLIGFTVLLVSSSSMLSDFLNTTSGSGAERLKLWNNSIELWLEKPLLGHGSGDWKIEILRTNSIQRDAVNNQIFFQRAHNEFLQTAVQNGIIGVIILIAFFVAAIYKLVKSNLEYSLKVMFAFGILGFIVIANFSFPFERIEQLLLLFLFIVPGTSTPNSSFLQSKSVKYFSGILTVLMIVFIFNWFLIERSFLQFKKTQKIDLLETIDPSYYSIDPTSTPLYWYEGNYFFENKNYTEAIKSYKKALKSNPFHLQALNNIAGSYTAIGNVEMAKKYYKDALKLNSKYVESLMNYASVSYNNGDIDEALTTLLSVEKKDEPENFELFVQVIIEAKLKQYLNSGEDTFDQEQIGSVLIDKTQCKLIFDKMRVTKIPFSEAFQMINK